MDGNQGNKVILKKFQPKWTAQVTSWYPPIGQTLPGTSSGERLSNGRGFFADQTVGSYEDNLCPWVQYIMSILRLRASIIYRAGR
jgi:hypothetical protein